MPANSRLDSEPRWKLVISIGLAQRFLNQGGSTKIAYREVGGRAPTVGALRRRQEQLAGSSQICHDLVQVQTVDFDFHDFYT